jgi:hypothetical protein
VDESPVVRPLTFMSSARETFPTENRHFTRWLADHLGYLEDALGLADLRAEEVESPMGDFFLDIRATAVDGAGQSVTVPIENQYSRTDHDHLGKLVTYTAQAATTAERVVGVWIVERARSEHVAAVTFLNEISPARVGWALLEVRFVPGPEGSYYVTSSQKLNRASL